MYFEKIYMFIYSTSSVKSLLKRAYAHSLSSTNTGLAKKSLWFFRKYIHFSFSLITLLIWIFWVCQLSLMWYNVDCSQLMFQFDCYQFQLVYLTVDLHPVRNLQHETLRTNILAPESGILTTKNYKKFRFSWLFFSPPPLHSTRALNPFLF